MTDLDRAVASLRAGELVVVPTDTVYGVAAIPTSARAIFRAKGRPDEKAIPILGANEDSLRSVARFDERAATLAERFWPGPLTLVIPRADGFTDDLGGTDDNTVAVRVPGSALTRALLEVTGPLAVTSANVSGEPPATTVGEARAALGDAVAVYLDEGPCTAEPSTVLSLVDGPAVLRSGGLAPDEVLSVL